MKTKTVTSTAMVLAVCSAIPLAAQDPATTVLRFHEAVAQRDSAAALAFLDPGVVIFESGGAEMSRDEFASGHLGADMAFASATEREITYTNTLVDGDIAVVTNRTHASGNYRDREIDSNGAETAVLRRVGGAWRIVHLHWSSRRNR